MIYNFTIIAEKGGSASSPEIFDMVMTHGIIHKIDVLFPPGSLGLTGVSIHNALHQVWPTNTDEYFTSDAEVISFREHHPLSEAPYSLQAYHYNTDDTYDHTIIIRIGILPDYVIAPWLLSYDERLRAALGVE